MSLSRTRYSVEKKLFYQFTLGEDKDKVGDLSSIYLYGFNDDKKTFEYVESYDHI